jgi:hypothetical protein
MKISVFPLLLALWALTGCGSPYSVAHLKPGMPKDRIVKAWGQPTVVPRTMEIADGSVMEIYQYETAFPRDINTLYFKGNKLWYWDKKDWRGYGAEEYKPVKKKR